MPFYVVRTTWTGSSAHGPADSTRVVAGCPSPTEAEGLALTEAAADPFCGRDPDSGDWWSADGRAVHRLEVTPAWPGDHGPERNRG
jgi:hypothetical protein